MADPFDTATSTPEPETKRDRYGRYLLPAVDGKKEQPWTRATTFAKSVADTFGLTQWEVRMVTAGIGMRRDLYALAAATPVDDKDKLNRIAKDAKEAAAASSGANLGTALHSFTEAHDRGEPVNPPEPWNRDLDAYRDALADAQITAVPEWIERIVIVPDLQVAGTLDRVVRLVDGRLVIGDVKTGKDLSYSWGDIAIQLALYANAPLMWNKTTEQYEPMPQVDRNIGIVMHLPAGKATCTIHQVDIAAGWEAAQLCRQVRAWRSRRNLAAQYTPTPAATTVTDRLATQAVDSILLSRIAEAATVDQLTQLWSTNQAGWTATHTAAAARRKRHLQTPTPTGVR
jgi:hypothetical protein